jgi:hypothetical protein
VEFVYDSVSGFLLRYDLVGSDVVMLNLVTLLRMTQLWPICMVIIVISSYEQE